MLQFNFSNKTLDKAAFLRDVRAQAQATQENAMGEFLKKIISEIPVWSGAAAATFIPLSRLAKMTLSIIPKVSPPFKDPNEHGIPAGRKAGFAKRIKSANQYGFEYSHSLHHLWLNENFNMNYSSTRKPTPWELLKDGSDAWFDYIDRNPLTINIFDYLR